MSEVTLLSVRTNNQNVTVAARAIADRKTLAQKLQRVEAALLHKSAERRGSPLLGRSHLTGSVTAMQSAV